MKIKSLKNYVTKNGGEVTECTETRLFGTLKGYDIEMISEGFFTIRKTSRAGTYDIGSDYNPGGYTFLHSLKSIQYFIA